MNDNTKSDSSSDSKEANSEDTTQETVAAAEATAEENTDAANASGEDKKAADSQKKKKSASKSSKSKASSSNGLQTTQRPLPPADASYTSIPVTIKSLMEAGAHFGHETPRWNPQMTPYIYGERNGVHIINLDTTVNAWEKARKFIVDTTARGGEVLFVGTKNQARKSIQSAAKRSASFFVTTRWLGGTLSNFQTIKNSISRMDKLEKLLADAEDENSDVKLAKKERLRIGKSLQRLESNLGGIRGMKRVPDVVFVTDILRENIAIAEARKLQIPIIALVDTNTNPGSIDFFIPSNDDSARTLRLFSDGVADAVIEGKMEFQSRLAKEKSQKSSAKKKKEVVVDDNASSEKSVSEGKESVVTAPAS